MSIINLQRVMLAKVAKALGNELLNEVVFVGGCTTGLLVTDDFTKEQIRYTDDVDLVVNVIGYPAWAQLQDNLRKVGFSDPMDFEDSSMCRMLLGELQVDFIPVDKGSLGFEAHWYAGAVSTAQTFQLTDELEIKLIQPEYFIATKLEAYSDRGNDDFLSSRDIEDILNVFHGRPTIVQEIKGASIELQAYISLKISEFLDEYDFELAVQSTSSGDAEMEALIFERLEKCVIND